MKLKIKNHEHKVISKEKKTEIKRVREVPVKCCSEIVIHKHFVSLRFCSKSELQSTCGSSRQPSCKQASSNSDGEGGRVGVGVGEGEQKRNESEGRRERMQRQRAQEEIIVLLKREIRVRERRTE